MCFRKRWLEGKSIKKLAWSFWSSCLESPVDFWVVKMTRYDKYETGSVLGVNCHPWSVLSHVTPRKQIPQHDMTHAGTNPSDLGWLGGTAHTKHHTGVSKSFVIKYFSGLQSFYGSFSVMLLPSKRYLVNDWEMRFCSSLFLAFIRSNGFALSIVAPVVLWWEQLSYYGMAKFKSAESP